MLSRVNRPLLIPGLTRAWRRPTELQLGADPAHAVVLRLPNPRVASVLDLLDGSRTERAVLVDARAAGVSSDEAVAVLGALEAAGLMVPAADVLPRGAGTDRLTSEAAALAMLQFADRSLAMRRAAAGPPAMRGPAGEPPPNDGPTSEPPPNAGPTSEPPPNDGPTSEPPNDGPASGPPAHHGSAAGRHGTPLAAARSGGGPPPGTPAAILRRRRAARAVISGQGRLGAGIAVALAEAGVGHVRAEVTGTVQPGEPAGGPLRGTDEGRLRRDAIHDALSSAAPGVDTRGVRRIPANLIIQLDHDEPVALVAAAHGRRAQPHLAVTIRDGAVVVGPLVPAAGNPCLLCVELHRRDRDANWPGPARPVELESCPVATLLAATAQVTAEALTFLDGGIPETLGAAVEIVAPGRVRRRTWPPHPDCDCTRRRRAAAA